MGCIGKNNVGKETSFYINLAIGLDTGWYFSPSAFNSMTDHPVVQPPMKSILVCGEDIL